MTSYKRVGEVIAAIAEHFSIETYMVNTNVDVEHGLTFKVSPGSLDIDVVALQTLCDQYGLRCKIALPSATHTSFITFYPSEESEETYVEEEPEEEDLDAGYFGDEEEEEEEEVEEEVAQEPPPAPVSDIPATLSQLRGMMTECKSIEDVLRLEHRLLSALFGPDKGV